jgi:hypothetical protein
VTPLDISGHGGQINHQSQHEKDARRKNLTGCGVSRDPSPGRRKHEIKVLQPDVAPVADLAAVGGRSAGHGANRPAPAPEAAAEIIVTAQKRSESLHNVPVAVSVVTGAALTAAARPSIRSASQLVPALNFQSRARR